MTWRSRLELAWRSRKKSLVLSGLWPAAILAVALGLAAPAQALDPARRIEQYKHTRWTSEEGAPTEVRAIRQTPDGFLWLGADDGLYRFDGVAFERIALPNPKHGHGSGINALLVTRSGALVVGFDLGGIGIYDKGQFSYLENRKVRGTIRALAEDRQGAIWVAVGSRNIQLARFQRGTWEIIRSDWGLPPGMFSTLLVDRGGTLWLGKDGWLGYLPPGERKVRPVDTAMGDGPGLAEDKAGRLWVSDSLGVRRFADPRAGRVETSARYMVGTKTRWNHIIVDQQQNLWGGGFGTGLFRVRAPNAGRDNKSQSAPTETFPAKSGLTGDVAWSVFEDREGALWVGTNGGLDRFRHANVMVQPHVSSDSPYGYRLLTLHRGAVLVGDRNTLLKAEPGQALKVWFDDLDMAAICEGPDQTLWIFASDPEGGADRIYQVKNGRRTKLELGWRSATTKSCSVDDSGGLWVTADGLPAQRWDGRAWRAYDAEGVPDFTAVVATGAHRALLMRNRQLFEADAAGIRTVDYGADRFYPGSLVQVWRNPSQTLVAGSNGLVQLGRQSRFVGDSRFGWLQDVNGLASQEGGTTWVRNKGGVTQIQTSDLDRTFVDPRLAPATRTYTLLDGLAGSGTGALERPVTIGGDNRVWLATSSGVFVIDPNHLYRNATPPPVAITAVVVDGRAVKNLQDLVLPRGARSLQIDYSALSMAMPERVRFKYRLEGVDRSWIDPGKRRQAFYTNLPPGHYVFTVKAANEDGVWNEAGASLNLQLPPTFLQSKFFLALCVLAALGLAWAAYALRLRQVSERIQGRLQERVAERERIARELHDTLLQGVQGLMLKFQVATNQVPKEMPARDQLESLLDRADDVLLEARERVRSLRSATGENLALALTELAARTDPDRLVQSKIEVEGAERPLHPGVADEIEKIVGEALFNAFQHAKAKAVVVEITYDVRQLGVRIRDDGVGIDQAVLDAGGREGHFGLTGMHERAAKIQGVLTIRSRPGAGTEIELSIPASVAYGATPSWFESFLPSMRPSAIS